MRIKFAIAAAAICFSFAAHAANWKLVSTSKNVQFFVAIDTVKRSGNVVDYWTKKVYTPAKSWKSVTYSYTVTHDDVDCARRTWHSRSITAYDDSGAVVGSATDDHEWKEIVPETNMDAVASRLCRS
ncbi:hypothetical protein BTHE68_71890 (plasmid) [Burkholderia sp. THE68]|nr:hypothetical protein BTHE68_71890 [Burkholderia sp. THE68]